MDNPLYINGESVLSMGESCKGIVKFHKEEREHVRNEEEINGWCIIMEYLNLDNKRRGCVS